MQFNFQNLQDILKPRVTLILKYLIPLLLPQTLDECGAQTCKQKNHTQKIFKNTATASNVFYLTIHIKTTRYRTFKQLFQILKDNTINNLG